MGSSYLSIHLHDTTQAAAADAIAAYYRDRGDTLSGALVAPPEAGAWTAIFPGSDLDVERVAEFARHAPAPGVELQADDSDTWAIAIFAGREVVFRFSSRAPAPPAAASELRRAARSAFGLDLPPDEVESVLAARPTYAEDAMDACARLFGITRARNRRELLRRGIAEDVDLAELVAAPAEAPAEAPRQARSYNVYVYALIRRRPPAGFGREVIDLLHWARDELNGGRWGSVAHATTTSGDAALAGLAPVDPAAVPPEGVLASARRGFTDEELARLAALVDAGEVRSLDVDLDLLNFNYRRESPDYHWLQLLFYDLLDEQGATPRPERFEAVFAPDSGLAQLVFGRTGADYGFVAVVPADAKPGSETLTSLVTWPPTAHWLTYLSPELTRSLGGVEALRSGLAGFAVEPADAGGTLVRLPLRPEESEDAGAARLKAVFAAVTAHL